MAKAAIQYLLRMPPELHERIKRIAERENRSMNAQILHILKKWVDAND